MKNLLSFIVMFGCFCLPATAQEASKSKEDLILKKLDDLQKSFNDVSKDLKKDIGKNTEDIKSLKADLENLREELTILRNEKYRPPKSDLNGEQRKLRAPQKDTGNEDEDDFDSPKKKLLPPPRTKVEYEDISSSKNMVKNTEGKTGGNPPEVQYSKIKIINYWNKDYVVLVNGEKHTVKAKETLIVDYVMPGSFTYQVVGLSEVRTRDLKPKYMHTITIGTPQPATQTPVPFYANQPMYYYPPCHER